MSEVELDAAVNGQHKSSIPRSEFYLKVLSFVISNAWRGENMAVENYSEMVPLMDTVEDKIEAVNQAREEAKHILALEKLGESVGASVDETMCQDDWPGIRATFHEAAQKGDLAACLIIQDLMIESLAIGIYSTFASEDNRDTETRTVASLLLEDELEHLGIGLRRISGLLESDSETVHDSLVWAHNRVAPLMFSMVHSACDFLCERKNVPCDSRFAFVQNAVLYLTGERKGSDFIDLDRLKVASLEQYVDMLDKAGFDVAVTNRLVASMAAYETGDGRDTGIGHVLHPRAGGTEAKPA